MIRLIAASAVAAYLIAGLLTARWAYQRMRPWTEPLGCTTAFTCERVGHSHYCYARYGLIDSNSEALSFALMWAVFWWAVLPAFAVLAIARPLVTSGARELPAEREARTRRLERDLGMGDR